MVQLDGLTLFVRMDVDDLAYTGGYDVTGAVVARVGGCKLSRTDQRVLSLSGD
jgi:hypothetical protein